MPVGLDFTLRASSPIDYRIQREVTRKLDTDAQTLTANLQLPGNSTLRVTVLASDGVKVVGASLAAHHPSIGWFYAGPTDCNGVADIASIPEGQVPVSAYTADGNNGGSVIVDLTAADNGQVVNVTSTGPNRGTVATTLMSSPPVKPDNTCSKISRSKALAFRSRRIMT